VKRQTKKEPAAARSEFNRAWLKVVDRKPLVCDRGRSPANCIKTFLHFWRISPQTKRAAGVMIVPAKEIPSGWAEENRERKKERMEIKMRIMRRTSKGTVVTEIDCTARNGKSLFLICRYGRYEHMDTVIELADLSVEEQEQIENILLEKGYLDISRYDWAVYDLFFGVMQDWLNIK
jgi:hypothetical protein